MQQDLPKSSTTASSKTTTAAATASSTSKTHVYNLIKLENKTKIKLESNTMLILPVTYLIENGTSKQNTCFPLVKH